MILISILHHFSLVYIRRKADMKNVEEGTKNVEEDTEKKERRGIRKKCEQEGK
jgi:hypothetical protein